MSGRSGKKIAEFFNSAQMIAFHGQIERLAKTLEQRPFGQKHFQQTHKLLEDVFKDIPEVVRLQIAVRANNGMMEYLWLSAMYVMCQDSDNDLHSIVQHDFSMKNTTIQNMSRRYPLQINAPHTFFRFIQRTGTTLNYNTPAFEELCGMSILLTLAHASYVATMRLDPSLNYPAVLPFQGGLVLGEISLTNGLDEHTVHFSHDKIEYINGSFGHSAQYQLSKIPELPIHFYIKTSISSQEFLGRQGQLYQMLQDCFYGDAQRKEVLTEINRAYIGRQEPAKELTTLRVADTMIADLIEIFQTPAWQEHAQKRTPKPRPN